MYPPQTKRLKVGVWQLAWRVVPRVQWQLLAGNMGWHTSDAHAGVAPLAVGLPDCKPLPRCVTALSCHALRTK